MSFHIADGKVIFPLGNDDMIVVPISPENEISLDNLQLMDSILRQLSHKRNLSSISLGELRVEIPEENTFRLINFSFENDGLSIILNFRGEQINMDHNDLMWHFGMWFVGYQHPGRDYRDDLQVFIERYGTTVFVIDGAFDDLDIYLSRAYELEEVIMALNHKNIQFPDNLNFSIYTFIDDDNSRHSIEMLQDGQILLDDATILPYTEIIRRFA